MALTGQGVLCATAAAVFNVVKVCSVRNTTQTDRDALIDAFRPLCLRDDPVAPGSLSSGKNHQSVFILDPFRIATVGPRTTAPRRSTFSALFSGQKRTRHA